MAPLLRYAVLVAAVAAFGIGCRSVKASRGFAAAVPIAGVPPERALAPRLAAANLLLVHGLADTENPPEPTRAMVAALEAAGARRVRLREYEGLGHQVPPEMIAGTEWREWLFAQRR